MTNTVTLDEKDLAEAIGLWLEQKHKMRLKGTPRVEKFDGDQRDPGYVSVTVTAEPLR